ncbi:hypothetical protein HG537_0D02740 [Torulaspora globosa]|uniref:Micro-fibrillar-associated protein 1 C-terminal domain-containing protein n=1 Tax=Torulaspora globosa TaxID=48254 RepID=A0A7H9HSK7_9SACH|nr:hypothetical protein HG537_0D02740 [Torulaspora sp. CBS 2947]
MSVRQPQEGSVEPVVEDNSFRQVSGSESSDEMSSSDDDENVVAIQRPQFLNKAKRQQIGVSVEERPAKKRDTLNERIRQDNLASEAREKLESQLNASLGTNDELLRRILALDDNDTVDPEYERQEWLGRCDIRKKLRRDALLAKQLELEQYEANKLNAGQPTETVKTALQKSEPESRRDTRFKNPNQRWKPSRAQDTRFSNSMVMPEDSEETEYSYI